MFGGVFIKAKDPEALKKWYVEQLGLPVSPHGFIMFQAKGGERAVFSMFEASSKHFPGAFMINFRVADLDATLAKLRAAGATVDDERMDDPVLGRFGWCVDPEGNRVELWQPPPGR
jgi:predicted enzyme related to lactoylglutathione lyase